jgi:hypothetical protein
VRHVSECSAGREAVASEGCCDCAIEDLLLVLASFLGHRVIANEAALDDFVSVRRPLR